MEDHHPRPPFEEAESAALNERILPSKKTDQSTVTVDSSLKPKSEVPPTLEDFVDYDDDDTHETPVNVSPSDPNTASQVCSLLRNNPETVVDSLISDQNLWEAVMNNKKMIEHMQYLEKANKNAVNRSITGTGGETVPIDGSNVNQSTNAAGGEILPNDGSSASGSSPLELWQEVLVEIVPTHGRKGGK